MTGRDQQFDGDYAPPTSGPVKVWRMPLEPGPEVTRIRATRPGVSFDLNRNTWGWEHAETKFMLNWPSLLSRGYTVTDITGLEES